MRLPRRRNGQGGLNILIFLLSSAINIIEGAPDTLGIPIISTLLQGKSDGLKELVQSHSDKLLPQLSGDVAGKHPPEINSLISKLKPKQGRLDPVVVEMLSAFDRTYRDTTAAAGGSSTEGLLFPDEATSGRIASSTEENGVIWQDTTNRPQKRDRESSRFSSRYRSNHTEVFPTYPNVYNSSSVVKNSSDPQLPFDHISDPNIRNHRLYDWEFETYKNFTHIDQAEDLMADEDHAVETKVSVVAAPPNHQSQQHLGNDKAEKYGESIIPSGWTTKGNGSKSRRVQVKGMPHIVISLEDTSDNGFQGGVHIPSSGSYMKLPLDSGEPGGQRPREPLRQSSNEVVYVHGSAEDGRYPYNRAQSPDDRYPEGSMNDAVFMDPEQDFYTSTVRSNDPHHHHHQSEPEYSSETLPKRRRKKLRKISKKEDLDELSRGGRFSHRDGDRHLDDDHLSFSDHHGDQSSPNVNFAPEYSRNSMVGSVGDDHPRNSKYNNIHRTPGPHLIKPSKYLGPVDNSRVKADRILYPGGTDEYGGGQGLPSNSHYDGTQNQHNINSHYDGGQGQHSSNAHYDGYDETINHHHDGGIGNYYSLHNPEEPGLHANLGGAGAVANDANPYVYKNHDVTSTEYLGVGQRFQNALSALNIFGTQHQTKKLHASPTDQVIAPGNADDFYHPYAAQEDQVNQYYEDSYYNSWSNTFFILAGIIAFTAIFALLLPTFLTTGRYGKKDIRHDLDEDDLNTSTFTPTGSASNNNYHYDNTVDDIGQHPDIWSDIKGVYNDIVSLFRGDYSLLSKIRKGNEGPKIVYRDDEDHDDTDEDEDEDDEKNDDRMASIRNRKRQRYLKKQQQMLQKQQQKAQQMLRDQKAKKGLMSKTKMEAGRDNKDGKTINATSVNNLVVVSGPPAPLSKSIDEEIFAPRAATGFVIPDNSTMGTIPFNATGALAVGSAADSFLQEWAQVQLIQ